jgi:hypothetical protein
MSEVVLVFAKMGIDKKTPLFSLRGFPSTEKAHEYLVDNPTEDMWAILGFRTIGPQREEKTIITVLKSSPVEIDILTQEDLYWMT